MLLSTQAPCGGVDRTTHQPQGRVSPAAPLGLRNRGTRRANLLCRATSVDSVASAGLVEPPAVAAPAAPPPPSPTTKPPSDRITGETIQGMLSFYRSQLNEYDYWLSEELIEGEIPAELRGSLFRNGPGQLEIFGKRINQPFDGDGMVSRFTLADGKAHFSNRYVRTQGFLEEQESGKMLYAGAFATGNPQGKWLNNPFDFVVKNVGNTGVLQWAGRLFALHESGLPHEMDPSDLSTRGETDMGGSIDGKGPFAAHYRIMHEADGSKRWVTFGSKVVGLDSATSFYEYGQDGRLLHKAVHQIKRNVGSYSCRSLQGGAITILRSPGSMNGAGGAFGFFHDLAVTERHYVLLQNPTRLDFRKLFSEYIFGRCSIAECIVYDESLPTKVHLIPRPGCGGAAAKVFETAPFFSFHHVNAFEQDGKVVIDTLGWDTVSFKTSIDSLDPSFFKGGQRSELNRLVVDTSSGTVTRRSLSERCCEFSNVSAAVNGRPYRHAYMGASAIEDPVFWGPNQVLMKATFPEGGSAATAQPRTEVWAPGPLCYTQEPVFVARHGGTAEDDGWVLLLVNNAESERTDLCILDAQKISDGPVCTLHLPHHIPPGLHGSWAECAVHVTPPEQLPEHWQPSFGTIRH